MNFTFANRAIIRRFHPLAWLTLLLLVAYLPGLIALARGAWPFADDAPALFGPWRQFTRNSLLDGRLPLWNPHVFCGLPFLANGQSSVLYPPNLIYEILPMRAALWSDAFAHNLILTWGGYFLARALGLSRAASFVVALCLSLSGPVSSHLGAGHMTWHAARAWIPCQLWALCRLLQSGRRRFAIALAIAFAAQIFAGYPPLVLLSAGLCVVLGFVVIIARRDDVRWNRIPVRPLMTLLAMSALLIGLLSAVIIVPLREMSAQTVHGSGLSWHDATELSGGPRTLLRTVLPNFFGGNAQRQWSLIFGAHEEASYIGLLPLILAIAAPWIVRGDAQTRRFQRTFCTLMLGLMILAAILAMGARTPIYGMIFDALPPFRLLRIPVRWMELWSFAAALNAGFAFDALLRRQRGTLKAFSSDADSIAPPNDAQRANLKPRRFALSGQFQFLRAMLAALAIVIPCIGALALATTRDDTIWPRLSRLIAMTDANSRVEMIAHFRRMMIAESALALVIALVAWWIIGRFGGDVRRLKLALIALIALDLTALFWRDARWISPVESRRFVDWPPTLSAQFRRGERWTTGTDWRAINGAMPHGIDLFNGYDAMNGRDFWTMANRIEGRQAWADMYQPTRPSPLLRVAGVTAHLNVSDGLKSSLDAGARRVATAQKWELWRVDGAWPRLYLSDFVVRRPISAQISTLETLAARSFPHGHYPVVLPPNALRGTTKSRDISALKVPQSDSAPGRVLEWRRSSNRLKVSVVSSRPAILVCGEAWNSDWRAFVNGREVEVARANVLFRAVEVPRGDSTIEWVYDSRSLRLGAFWSLCGLGILSALAMQKLTNRR